MEKKTAKPRVEQVLQEFAPLGKYRVRLLNNPKKPGAEPVLDIREFVHSETFEGFTRRGIRLIDRAQMDLLRDVLKEALERAGFLKPAPGTLPLQ